MIQAGLRVDEVVGGACLVDSADAIRYWTSCVSRADECWLVGGDAVLDARHLGSQFASGWWPFGCLATREAARSVLQVNGSVVESPFHDLLGRGLVIKLCLPIEDEI